MSTIAKDNGNLLQAFARCLIDKDTGEDSVSKSSIGPGDPGYIPKEHLGFYTTKTGKRIPYDKRKGRKIPKPKGSVKRIVSTEPSKTSLHQFVARTLPKQPASEKKYVLSTGAPKLRTSIGTRGRKRRIRRTKRSLHVNPVSGEVYGRGVKKIPSDLLERLKYGGTSVAVRTGLAGVQAGAEGLYERLARKARDVVNLSRMDPEMRAKAAMLRAKRAERKRKTIETLRRHGVFNVPEPSFSSKLAGEIGDSMKITAAAHTAKFVTELLGRKVPFYPIEVRINPDKMKAMLDYNRDKSTGNIYMRLARTQSTINEIEEGRAAGDPRYDTPDTDSVLMELYRVKRDIEREAEHKYGKGWLRAKSERERAALVEMTVETRKLFREAFQSARSKGYDKDSAYDLAYKYTSKMLGTHPISQRALADVAVSFANVPETVPQAAKNRSKHARDFNEDVKRVSRLEGVARQRALKESIAAKKKATAETFRARGGVTRENAPEFQREVGERVKFLREKQATERGSKQIESEMRYKVALGNLRYGREAKRTRQQVARLVEHGRAPEALRLVQRRTGISDKKLLDRIATTLYVDRKKREGIYGAIPPPRVPLPSQAGKHKNPRKKGGEVRVKRTPELEESEGTISNLTLLRDLVGKAQSKGYLLKQFTSTPVSGLALVRQDLQGGRKGKKRTKRTQRARW